VIFLGMSSPVLIIGLVYYFMKRLEHKQILAAIEKGTPLSELKPPKQKQNGVLWIKNLTFGIALLIIGLGLLIICVLVEGTEEGTEQGFMISLILCGVGLAWLIRGLLYRKYQPQGKTSDENKAADAESKVSA
ncbi:MAG: DUF6249 domain-containing protein, partial [Planctomycetota bacterium]